MVSSKVREFASIDHDDMVQVQLPSGFLASSVAGSFATTCVLSTTSDIVCFGDNQRGECGVEHADGVGDDAGEMGDNLKFTDLGSDFDAVKIVGDERGFCALSTGGKVKC